MNENISHRRIARLLLGIAAALTACSVMAGVAHARQVPPYFYSGTFFDGSGSTTGPFTSQTDNQRIAYDEQSGTFYVITRKAGDGDWLSKFDSSGAPEPFSDPGLEGATAFRFSEIAANWIRVDNTGGPTQGNIYISSSGLGELLYGFSPSGARLPHFPRTGFKSLCGIGVDPQGDIWAMERPRGAAPRLTEYSASGTPTGGQIDIIDPSLPTPCNVDIDTNGNFYVSNILNQISTTATVKFDPRGRFLYHLSFSKPNETAVDRSNDDVFVANDNNIVRQYTSHGALLAEFGPADEAHSYEGLQRPGGIAIDPVTHDAWVSSGRLYGEIRHVEKFTTGTPVTRPTVLTESVEPTPTSAVVNGIVNPEGVETTECHLEWATSLSALISNPTPAPCLLGGVDTDVFTGESDRALTAEISPLTKTTRYYVQYSATNANGTLKGGLISFRASEKPDVAGEKAVEVGGDEVELEATVSPNGSDTYYHVEYGPDASYGSRGPAAFPQEQRVGSLLSPVAGRVRLAGLKFDTVYHYRFVAENDAGKEVGSDRVFRTFPLGEESGSCPNAQARQHSGAALLLDCRSYELVSAADAGGYDVESDLIPGQVPLTARPSARNRVLYSMHQGIIPGVGGNPTNLGRDPYVAVRSSSGWATQYVGLPADAMAQEGAFGSPLLGTDPALRLFAFGGPSICDPCFPDGSTNVPLRLSNGGLVKGMAGSLSPAANPVGFVAKSFSDDGSHFVFGSSTKFESAGNEGSVSIYDRNVDTPATQVVSTLPGGATMTGEVGELGISADGSRIVVATKVSTDGAGNTYWVPYMHIGSSASSVALAPGASSGVLFAGMSSDGSAVFFTTSDKLLGADTDESADLYEAAVDGGGTVTLKLLSTGATPPVGNSDECDPAPNADGNNWNAVGGASADRCSVVAIAAGGGVATGDGTVYFLSPEELDGEGTMNEPNLFVVRPSQSPHFVATLDEEDGVVRNATRDNDIHRYGDFQVTPNGHFAAFGTTMALTGYPAFGHAEIYRYDAVGGGRACASCASSNKAATSDTMLPPHGLSLTDDGRVFFTSAERLVLRDKNQHLDAYEWSNGTTELISQGERFDSSLLSASADGEDVFFFTRDVMDQRDGNGSTVKIYDAREAGGFDFILPSFPCAASDECHGPGTVAADPPSIRTSTGSGFAGEAKPRKRCKRGFSKRRGKCVRRRKRHRARRHRRARNASRARG